MAFRFRSYCNTGGPLDTSVVSPRNGQKTVQYASVGSGTARWQSPSSSIRKNEAFGTFSGRWKIA